MIYIYIYIIYYIYFIHRIDLSELLGQVTECMRGPAAQEVTNDHHSPLRGDDYCRFRLEGMLKFYKKRIPGYHRVRIMGQVLTIFSSSAGVVLAANSLLYIAAITACLATGVQVYSSFFRFVRPYVCLDVLYLNITAYSYIYRTILNFLNLRTFLLGMARVHTE